MKTFVWMLLCLMVAMPMGCVADVVINEVVYDPVGADDYYEWIEFYNNGTTDVQMQDWRLYSGGSSYVLNFVFPAFFLRPGHYLLLAEEDCPDAHFFTNLTFQNGGSSTDGIRLCSPDSSYSDTILYDEPNVNHLADDLSSCGNDFVVDVQEGHSLARVRNGEDHNESTDWVECSEPTPGYANQEPSVLQLGSCSTSLEDTGIRVYACIHNLSTHTVDNSHASLIIEVNGLLNTTAVIPAISAQDSITISVLLFVSSSGITQICVRLHVSNDPNAVDNMWITSVLWSESPLIFNEVLFAPITNQQEWIELYNRGDTSVYLTDLRLEDRSHNHVSFSLTVPSHSYRVLCRDKALLLDSYASAVDSCVVELMAWVPLNNDDETISLFMADGTILDSLSYHITSDLQGHSLERRSPVSHQWLISTASDGATPCCVNSVFSSLPGITLTVDMIPTGGTLLHCIHLTGELLQMEGSLTCDWYADSDIPTAQIVHATIAYPADSLIQFTSPIPDYGYNGYHYQLRDSGDEICAESWSYYLRDSLPYVVNEIMFNPNTGNPEWLEIRKNTSMQTHGSLTVHVGMDSVVWIPEAAEYTVFVHDAEDELLLQDVFHCVPACFITGLSTLSNEGEQLYISDSTGNTWDHFTYLPEYSKMKGVSMERVQSCVLAGSENWGASVAQAGGTPGSINSIAVTTMPTTQDFNLQPNPFFPSRNERCCISFQLTRPVSNVTCHIYDLKGRLVRSLADQSVVPALGYYVWDGTDSRNRMLPTGIYLVVLEADSHAKREYRKMKEVVLGH